MLEKIITINNKNNNKIRILLSFIISWNLILAKFSNEKFR